MTPEQGIEFEQFKNKVAQLTGDDLLDKWIDFKASAASKEPDLGLLKSICLEQALIGEHGFGKWQKAVEARKAAR